MEPKVKAAFEKVIAELKSMTPEEFRAAMKEHENGEIATLIRYGLDPECRHEPHCSECAEDAFLESSRDKGW